MNLKINQIDNFESKLFENLSSSYSWTSNNTQGESPSKGWLKNRNLTDFFKFWTPLSGAA